MMEKVKRLAKSRPVLFAAVCTVAAMLIWAVELDGNSIGGIDMVVSHVLTSALALWLMHALSILSSAGFGTRGFGRGLLLGIPFYVLGIASALFSNPGMEFAGFATAGIVPTLRFTLAMFMVGFGEEVLFRGLVLGQFLSLWGETQKGIVRSVWVSAAIFGAVHLMNMLVAQPLTVLVQTLNAASAGVLFAAIYIRCRNLWAVIAVHTIVDWLALALEQLLPQATSIVASEITVAQGVLVVLVGSAVPLLVAWLLLRGRRPAKP